MKLDELEQLARAATPGPWKYDHDRYGEAMQDAKGGSVFFAGSVGYENATLHISDDDAAYIAALSPDVVLKLIDAVRAAAQWEKTNDYPVWEADREALKAALTALDTP